MAGIRLDLDTPQWIRLYPVPFRYLLDEQKFKKYDVVCVDVRPADADSRRESHKINLDSLEHADSIAGWKDRAPYIRPLVIDDMCKLAAEASADAPTAPSLAAVWPREIQDLQIQQHPGWTEEQRRKLEAFAAQTALFGDQKRVMLESPRFLAYYRYRCGNRACRGHRQGILDWELVAYQRRLKRFDEMQAAEEIRSRWLTMMCGSDRDTVFYVGNLARRHNVFEILGVFYPYRGHLDHVLF